MQSAGAITKLFLTLLCATSVAHAHSWVEQLMVIASNGTFVGEPGYPRGNIRRDEAGFGDPQMVHLVTGQPTDPMCKASQKSPSSQSASSPRLRAAPGAYIALRFQENGHVTIPDGQLGKPQNRGDIFVYGTTQPKDDELLADVHGVWTADGSGGDGRGVLLAKAAYDDGQCYQVNDKPISIARQKQFPTSPNQLMGADLWCQTDVRLPSDAPSGQPYTLYWVWDWPTAAGPDPGLPAGKNETYTTCMDIDATASEFSQKVATSDLDFIQDQPIENAAIPAQLAKLDEDAVSVPVVPEDGDAAASDAKRAAEGVVTVTMTVTATMTNPAMAEETAEFNSPAAPRIRGRSPI